MKRTAKTPARPPAKPARPPKTRGLIQVYTGDGKGKTTAALGLAVRAAGAGLRTAIVYFDKGGEHYSERLAITDHLADEIQFFVTGLDRIDPDTGSFRFGVTAGDREEADKGLVIARSLLARQEHDLVVLDEFITSVSTGLIDEQEALALIKEKPADTELVLTGRGCPASFIELADLVSEIGSLKHYFDAGVPARPGFDY